jgi:hypothetical protein
VRREQQGTEVASDKLGGMSGIGRGPLILFVAAAFLFADAVLIWIGSQADFAFDFTCCYQQAARRALDAPSTLYDWSETYTFRYTPIGALVFAPLIPLSEGAAAAGWLLVKMVVLVLAAVWFSRGWPTERRVLVGLLVVAFPPIVHDLMIGNVSTFTLVAYLAVARWQDPRGGIVLGALAVLAPKPHLIPVLAWMAIRRPRDFAAAAATMLAGIGIGLVIFGPDPWMAFMGTLREPLERTFTANVGFSALLGPAGVVIGLLAAAALWALAVAKRGGSGLGLAILSGVVLGPYTFVHYLAGVLVAVEPVLRSRPRLLVPFPWLLIVFPLIPVWLLALAWLLWRHDGEVARPAAAPG